MGTIAGIGRTGRQDLLLRWSKVSVKAGSLMIAFSVAGLAMMHL